jgi:uncharacterized protein
MLCGFLCGGDTDPLRTWLEQLFPSAENTGSARDALRALGAETLATSSQSDFGLTLLSPDDDRPLAERAIALYDWVRGFLYALGILGVSERDLTEEGREVYLDLADLTRMDLDALDDNEENEAALAEVTEFVRIAAMLIREERSVRRAGASA